MVHNFSIALNPTLTQLRSNLEVLEQAVSEDMYRVWVPPGNMVNGDLAVAATYTDATATIPEHWELTEAAGSIGVQWLLPVHPQWKDGVFWYTVYYATNGTSAGNVLWRSEYQVLQNGTALGSFGGATPVFAAPTVAGQIYKLDLYNDATAALWPLTAGDIAIKCRVGRGPNNASDTHTDDIQLFGVVVHYKESRRQL